MQYLKTQSLCVGLLTCTTVAPSWGQSMTASRPNILWIVTDDHRPDSIAAFNRAVTGLSESPLGFVSSPSADKLAKEGVLFTQAYCNAPSCSPSRASMQTGQYPFRNGVYGFENFHRRESFTRPMIADVMVAAGYGTAVVGKLDTRRHKPGEKRYDIPFDAYLERAEFRKTRVENRPFWTRINGELYLKERYHFSDGNFEDIYINKPEGPLTAEEIARRKALESKYHIIRPHTLGHEPGLATLIMAGEATLPKEELYHTQVNNLFLDYLRHPDRTFEHPFTAASPVKGPVTSKPLFVHLSYEWPHTPVLPPKEFRDQFKHLDYKIPKFSKAELEKLPLQMRQIYERFKTDEMTEAEQLRMIRDYYAFCAYGDWLIGQAVDAFKEYSRRLNQHWVIIYTVGDHAWHLGENGITAKFGPYNKAMRCTIIAVSSDKSLFPPNTVCHDLVEFVDLAPTFYSLAGLSLEDDSLSHLDGYPLMSILRREKSREYVLAETNHSVEHRASIRNKEFVFSMRTRPVGYKPINGVNPQTIKWGLEAPEDAVDMTLFDLRVDPLERNNVANDPKYRELARWFRQKLGRIVLGDRRIECNWQNDGEWQLFDFAKGADDKRLNIPKAIIPPSHHHGAVAKGKVIVQ